MSETVETSTIAIFSSNPIQILHVDDDRAFLTLSKQCLELQSDIQVDSALSVQEALEKLKEKNFDVIVSDYEMFEKDGLQFLQELRTNGNITPFILFTGKGRDELAVKALNLGAFRFMNKLGSPKAVYSELASCVRQATNHTKTIDALKESEKRFQFVFDSSIDAIVMLNEAGNIVYSNKSAQVLFDYAQESIVPVLKEHFSRQFTEAYEQNMHDGFKTISEGKVTMSGKTMELELRKPSGESTTVELSFSAFTENDQWYGVSIVRDVTERKNQEIRIRESEEKFAGLFSQNPGAIVFTDKDFLVTDINHSFTALFGYKPEEIKGKFITDVIVPKGLEEESEIIREKILEGPVGCSTIRKRSDGSLFNASLSGGPIIVDGKITGFFMVYMDISDVFVVQEELSKALAKAERLNEKIVVLGGFTRHDVRNKLALIQGNLFLAREKCVVTSDLEKYLHDTEEVIKNITDILDFAKTYEMIGSEELVPTEVGGMVQNAASLFSNLKGVKIENECCGFETLADSLLTQVFHNLIDNSLKYGTEKITNIRIHKEENTDGSTKLIYEDNGVGIDEKTKTHLFQRGFGRGTGFGLYLIRKICEVYGWTVEEKGQFGMGAKFEFSIPAMKPTIAAFRSSSASSLQAANFTI